MKITHRSAAALRTAPRRAHTGFSLLELMIALSLSLVLAYAFINVYISSQGASRRQEQLSTLQNSVRTAFEYITTDVHAVGLSGCFTRRGTPVNNFAAVPDLRTNYTVAVEGYNATDTPAYPLLAVNTSANWATNIATGGGINTIPMTGSSMPLTKGSDILVLRTASSRPLRLHADANSVVNKFLIDIEATDLGGTCVGGSAKVSGLCPSSHALIASCTNARVVQVQTAVSNGTSIALTLQAGSAGLGGDPTYAAATTSVFPLQTVMYYVRPSTSGTTQSLYRRVFDGDDGPAGEGEEQELIEDVENIQVRYGVDTITANPDASPDYTVDSYVTANAVTDWSKVIAVRMSLLMRARDPVRGDAEVPASAPVGDVNVIFPTSGPRHDRRVFTTTVALRNRVAF